MRGTSEGSTVTGGTRGACAATFCVGLHPRRVVYPKKPRQARTWVRKGRDTGPARHRPGTPTCNQPFARVLAGCGLPRSAALPGEVEDEEVEIGVVVVSGHRPGGSAALVDAGTAAPQEFIGEAQGPIAVERPLGANADAPGISNRQRECPNLSVGHRAVVGDAEVELPGLRQLHLGAEGAMPGIEVADV